MSITQNNDHNSIEIGGIYRLKPKGWGNPVLRDFGSGGPLELMKKLSKDPYEALISSGWHCLMEMDKNFIVFGVHNFSLRASRPNLNSNLYSPSAKAIFTLYNAFVGWIYYCDNFTYEIVKVSNE